MSRNLFHCFQEVENTHPEIYYADLNKYYNLDTNNTEDKSHPQTATPQNRNEAKRDDCFSPGMSLSSCIITPVCNVASYPVHIISPTPEKDFRITDLPCTPRSLESDQKPYILTTDMQQMLAFSSEKDSLVTLGNDGEGSAKSRRGKGDQPSQGSHRRKRYKGIFITL